MAPTAVGTPDDSPSCETSRLGAERLRMHTGGPRLEIRDVGDASLAHVEHAACGVDDRPCHGSAAQGLRFDDDDAQLARLEPADWLDRVDELPAVQMAVAEVPAEHHARNHLSVDPFVAVDVVHGAGQDVVKDASLQVQESK